MLLQPAGPTRKRALKERKKKKSFMKLMFHLRGSKSMMDKKYLIFPSFVFSYFLLNQMSFSPVMEQVAPGARAGPCHAQLRVLMKSFTQSSPGGQRQSRWKRTRFTQSLLFALLPRGLLPGEAASSESRSITSVHEERRISMVTVQSLKSKCSTSG